MNGDGHSNPQPPGAPAPRRRGIWHEDPGETRIPRPDPSVALLRRSSSMRARGEKSPASRRHTSYFPVITETSEHRHGDAHGDRQPNRHSSLSTSALSRPHSTPTSGQFPFTPTSSPIERVEVDEDDLDSLQSFGSVFSTMSCDHAFVARNGTTFSGRRMKYVVHCSSHAGETDEYLTPTQRATRQIRRLKALLKQANADLEEKNNDIFRLTKEVVELRLCPGSNAIAEGTDVLDGHIACNEESAPKMNEDQESSCSKEVINENEDVMEKHNCCDLPSSLADSGHFEDIATMSVHSKDSMPMHHSPMYHPMAFNKDMAGSEDREGERRRIVNMFEKKIEEMQRNHIDENQELKEKHNDKVENLLSRLSESNERCSELRAEAEAAHDKARQLEKEAESLRKTVADQEERHQSMYLKMYVKGQEAAKFEHADQVLEFAHQAPNRVCVPELLKQLQVTENELENIKDRAYQQPDKTKTLLSAKEAVSLYLLGTRKAMYRRIVETQAGTRSLDPEITLQFLKSAVYYLFTDKENHQGHLNAIASILGYSDIEKRGIEKGYRAHFK